MTQAFLLSDLGSDRHSLLFQGHMDVDNTRRIGNHVKQQSWRVAAAFPASRCELLRVFTVGTVSIGCE
jgi:hypothetical protein